MSKDIKQAWDEEFTSPETQGNNIENTEVSCCNASVKMIRDTIRGLIIDLLEEEGELMPDIPDTDKEVSEDDKNREKIIKNNKIIDEEIEYWENYIKKKAPPMTKQRLLPILDELLQFAQMEPTVIPIEIKKESKNKGEEKVKDGETDKEAYDLQVNVIVTGELYEKIEEEKFKNMVQYIDRKLLEVLNKDTTEDVTLMICGNTPYQPKGFSGRNNVLIKTSQLESFNNLENFLQVYGHERIHTLIKQIKPKETPLDEKKFYYKPFSEGICNYLAIRLLEDTKIPEKNKKGEMLGKRLLDPQRKNDDGNAIFDIRQVIAQGSDMSSVLLNTIKNKYLNGNPKSEYEALKEFWSEVDIEERGKRQGGDSMKKESHSSSRAILQKRQKTDLYYYEFGQTLVEVFLDQFSLLNKGVQEFLILYEEFYNSEYKSIGTIAKFERCMEEKGYSNDNIREILNTTTNRLLLKSLKGERLFDYLIELELDELKIVLQNQELHVVLGISRNAAAEFYLYQKDSILTYLGNKYNSQAKIDFISQYFDRKLEQIKNEEE